jgi:hypothetical protein
MSDIVGDARRDGGGSEFWVLLPVVGGEPTHVVAMRGEELDFIEALEDAVQSGDEGVEALLLPVDATPLGQLADILNAIGEASVQSIDPVGPSS